MSELAEVLDNIVEIRNEFGGHSMPHQLADAIDYLETLISEVKNEG